MIEGQGAGGKACARCHEIWQPYTDWHTSAHRNVSCSDCHGSVCTVEAGFHINNMRRIVTHLRGMVPEEVHFRNQDVLKTVRRFQLAAEAQMGLSHEK